MTARQSRSRSAPRSAGLRSIRTTPGRPSTAAGACRRCCCRGIISGSRSGAASAAGSEASGASLEPVLSPPTVVLGDGRPLPCTSRRATHASGLRLTPPVTTMSSVIETIERAQLRRVPRSAPGDGVKVHFQVIEGSRRRVQVFEGVVIKRQGHGARETFTVRKQSFGVGVERSFPVHSPKIERIELAARGDVRRAKLYYLRGRVGKRARVRERRYAGPEESVEPGLLAGGSQLTPGGATYADGLTAYEAVMADAQDAQPTDGTGEDAGDSQPAPSGDGQAAPSGEGQAAPSGEGQAAPTGEGDAAPSGEGQAHGSGQTASSETPATATDADPSSEAGERDKGVLAADEPA